MAGNPVGPSTPNTLPSVPGSLTPREREVVLLVAEGHTNREIAASLVIATSTAERHVANILGKLSLRSRAELAAWAIEQGLARGPTAAVWFSHPRSALGERGGNLPAELSSFVGRERELDELSTVATSARLLTLTGAGGIGKTRLGLRLATNLQRDFADGVWLVRLEALASPELVPAAVAAALHVHEEAGRPLVECLAEAIGFAQVLLVLDNCEHVVTTSAELVQTLLESCARLHVIATSREALLVPGEYVWRVTSLSVPTSAGSASVDQILAAEAVRLFVDRATAVRPDFALTSQNATDVAKVCRRLDGIPLAIELAAVRMKALSAAQLAQRLEDTLRVLTGGSRTTLARHQTLRAAIDWSYDRLSSPDREFLQRLAVFPGAWTLETAEAVCSGRGIPTEDVLDRLSALADSSLVIVEEHDEIATYRLLQPIRQYALQKLVESGGSELLNQRLAARMLNLVERVEAELRGPQPRVWFRRLVQEYDSLRAALGWAVKQDLRLALDLTRAAWPFWEIRLYVREGRNWLEQVIELSTGQDALAVPRGRALFGLAVMLYHQGDYELAAARLVEYLAIFDKPGDTRRKALALNGLGLIAIDSGDLTAAVRHFSESLSLWRAVDDPFDLPFVLANLARAVELQGDDGRAQTLLEESLIAGRELGHSRRPLPTLVALARLARRRHDRDGALAYLRETVAGVQRLQLDRGAVIIIDALASFALEDGQFVTAARLLGGAASVMRSVDFTPAGHDQPDRLHTLAAVRAHLGEAEFAAAWAEGQVLTPDEIVTQTMAVLDPNYSAATASLSPS
jgi:non-specific serine/threonine protein kinase